MKDSKDKLQQSIQEKDKLQGKEIRGTFCFAYTLGLSALPL